MLGRDEIAKGVYFLGNLFSLLCAMDLFILSKLINS